MSEQHTPTPWRLGTNNCVVSDTPVHEMSGSEAVEYYGGHLIAESVVGRNARRIVAAVNAVEGIKTEDLEQFVFALDTVKQQRDQLLSTLKRIAAEKPYLMHDDNQREFLCYGVEFNPCKEAREAVESVEGKG
ncbi:hypothetical protein [Chitinibacter tainanensis]|uniref:hypothetical protein n=1 Tax=Chitinibacter tainanensis TaxID=230667 RepID=UPI002355D741|nr:hypothetical protein [Chitinibacter tainanensis]